MWEKSELRGHANEMETCSANWNRMKQTQKVNWLFTKGNICRIISTRIHGLVSFGSLKDIGFTHIPSSLLFTLSLSFFTHFPHCMGHFSVCPIVTCFLSRHFRTKIKCRADVQARNVAICDDSCFIHTQPLLFFLIWFGRIQCAIEQENDFFLRFFCKRMVLWTLLLVRTSK